ncbi:MAG: hypothetical protein NXH75_06325 [Halobacteriovoraceae bacterium]|nr:hypothetical protein [Halobacteriovoraceae bacterium]
MKSILVVDFDDSFIHNICEFIHKLGYSYKLVHHSLVSKDLIKSFPVCLLGPGPGQCKEYAHIHEILKDKKVTTKYIGICLGFQMLGVSLGLGLTLKSEPVHGESLFLPKFGSLIGIKELKGQFYNSWCLCDDDLSFLDEHIVEHQMLIYLKAENMIGVQFHPESVGTSDPSHIMSFLLKEVHG